MKSTPVSPVLAGLLLVLCASVFTFVGWRGLAQDYRFDGDVGHSTATVGRLTVTSGGRHSTTYEAVLSFPAGSEPVSGVATRIAPSSYYRLHQGDQVPVKYLPDQPTQVRIVDKSEDDWHWRNDKTGLGVGLFFSALGLVVAWFGRKSNAAFPR